MGQGATSGPGPILSHPWPTGVYAAKKNAVPHMPAAHCILSQYSGSDNQEWKPMSEAIPCLLSCFFRATGLRSVTVTQCTCWSDEVFPFPKSQLLRGWREGSTVKIMYCFLEGSKFCSCTHSGGSQPSSGLFGNCTHMKHTHIYIMKTKINPCAKAGPFKYSDIVNVRWRLLLGSVSWSLSDTWVTFENFKLGFAAFSKKNTIFFFN